MKPIIIFYGSYDVKFDVKCSMYVLRPQKEVPWIRLLGTRGGLVPLVVQFSLFWAKTILDCVIAIVT
jgi:hypothetical protein